MEIYLETFGCSSNQALSESLSWIMESIGFKVFNLNITNYFQIYFCNSCTVKYTTEQKILYKIK